MKKVVIEDSSEGLESLLGENVMLLCMNYIYAGVLSGVNETCVLLTDAKIIYETGPWSDKRWKDAQAVPCPKFYVQTSAIESFGLAK